MEDWVQNGHMQFAHTIATVAGALQTSWTVLGPILVVS